MTIRAAALVILLAAGAAQAQDDFSLKGTWMRARERSAKVEGREGTATLVITEEQGRTFSGYLVRCNPTGDVREDLWGAFTPNGRLIMAADEEGYYSFHLVDPNTLDYCYAEAGASPRTTCARLRRQR